MSSMTESDIEHKPLRQDRLRLYRCACRVCEDAEAILRGLAERHSAELEVVRVDKDPSLDGMAGWRTPEVYLNDRRLSHFRLAERVWRKALEEESSRADDTLQGELVSLTCMLAHRHHGEEHLACARESVAEGSPMGILAADGQLYAVLETHEHRDVYEALKLRLASKVKVTGDVYARAGLQAVVVHESSSGD